MKNPLVALAALVFLGAASAQSSSSVTLWGLLDADVGHLQPGRTEQNDDEHQR